MTKQNWRKRLKKTGWYSHIQEMGYRSEQEFLGFIDELFDEQEEKIIRLMIRHYSEFTEEVWRPYRGSKTCGEVAIEWFKKLNEK